MTNGKKITNYLYYQRKYVIINVGDDMKDVSFKIDLQGGGEVLQKMAKDIVQERSSKIAGRANQIVKSMSGGENLSVEVQAPKVGVIGRGARAIGRVEIQYGSSRGQYVASQALAKSLDAGRE